MAGVLTAEVKHVIMMLVAVAPPIPLVTPLKRRGGRGEAPRQPRFASPKQIATAPPSHPFAASRKCHACHALQSQNG
eukprot:5627265-Pyramimonas_sp.AAC.1